MTHYQFKLAQLEDGLVEIRIVMPSPQNVVPTDLVGPEARKSIAKWILSSAAGLAATCRLNLHEVLHTVHEKLIQAVDYEHWRDLVVAHVRTTPCSPRDLEERPPDGMTPTQARIMAQELLDTGVLILNDRLKLELYSN